LHNATEQMFAERVFYSLLGKGFPLYKKSIASVQHL